MPLSPKRLSLPLIAAAGGIILSGCVSTGAEKAELPEIKSTKQLTEVAAVPARRPADRYTDPLVAARGPGTPVDAMQEPAALDTPPTAEVAGDTPPATLDEMVMQPTTATAGSGSIFANRQMAYVPAEARMGSGASASLVPSDLPARAGINPAAASLFSAPKPAETYQAYAEPTMESQPAGAEQLVAPPPAEEVAYDPAEPIAPSDETAEPAPEAKKKSFSLMRMLGRKGS